MMIYWELSTFTNSQNYFHEQHDFITIVVIILSQNKKENPLSKYAFFLSYPQAEINESAKASISDISPPPHWLTLNFFLSNYMMIQLRADIKFSPQLLGFARILPSSMLQNNLALISQIILFFSRTPLVFYGRQVMEL